MPAISQSLPTPEDLRERARASLASCAVAPEAIGGDQRTMSPILGSELARVRWSSPQDVQDAVARAQEAFRRWRQIPAPARGALVKRFGELLTRHQADLARLVTLEVGKITFGGAGRGPGDDRHLRLRRRAVPAALRPDHAVRAARAPADGDLAPARRRRRDLRVQLPGRGLVVEHRDRAGLRGSGDLEAVGADPADRAGLRRAARAGLRRGRCPAAPAARSCSARAEVGLALADSPGVALVSATGSTRMGRAVGPRVAARFGRCLLELGGNNAAVVAAVS